MLNREATTLYEEEEELDEEEENMMEVEKKVAEKPKKKKSNRKKWSAKEIEELQKYFSDFLDLGTTPRGAFIDKIKKKSKKHGGVIHLRENHLIIKKISNMNASKRQQKWKEKNCKRLVNWKNLLKL